MTTDITTLAIALETSSAITQIQQLTSRLDSLRSQSIRLRNADPFPAMGRNVSAFNSKASKTSAVMKGITAAASKLTAVLAGVFAVGKIVSFGTESVRVFSDLEEEAQRNNLSLTRWKNAPAIWNMPLSCVWHISAA